MTTTLSPVCSPPFYLLKKKKNIPKTKSEQQSLSPSGMIYYTKCENLSGLFLIDLVYFKLFSAIKTKEKDNKDKNELIFHIKMIYSADTCFFFPLFNYVFE